ncbi:MAG: ParB/RepB/Spo0J family partition protein [Bacteroidales bacterium]|nr:ParB/RepB/Spo0J family partition protein [Bacteroidales bacterium]
MKTKKSALGRGLSAILESPETDITSKDISGHYVVGAIASISLDQIETNPFQPRNNCEEDQLRELADSIREQGIIQPVTVRKLGYDKYQLISGERRFRASKMAGLRDIPCFIRVANDQQMLEMALIENIHREDLNALDIAISYQRLIEECQLTHDKLSKRIGKDRSTITNYIRLLKLPPEIQVAVRDHKISMGHARALINLPDDKSQLLMLEQILSKNLNVRIVEKKVQEWDQKPTSHKAIEESSRILLEAKRLLVSRFGKGTRIRKNNNEGGQIVIPFRSEEELERIISGLS